MTDDATDPRLRPTKTNILDAMHWLVQGAQPHDSLFFHCESLILFTCRPPRLTVTQTPGMAAK